MAELTHEAIRCPHCRGDLSITEHRGQTTCPHCQAPILLAGAGRREQTYLALPAEFGAFIADSVVARRGKEVILHGWHRSGHPEVVIKLRPQLGDTWSEKTRHPNVVRFLNSGTEGGVDYQVFEWVEGSDLESAAELLTSVERLSPHEVASPKKISPAKTVAAAPVQSEPPPPLLDSGTTNEPPIGARWRGRFNQRFHEGLVRGLGTKGLVCHHP